MRIALTTLMLIGCTSDGQGDPAPKDSDTEAVDLRREFPDAPEGGIQLLTPDYTIEAFSEAQFCWFTRWDGGDIGINYQATYQSDNGHHVVLLKTLADEDDFPDDAVFDCSDKDTLPMTDMEPIIFGRGIESAGTDNESTLELGEGMAVNLNEGTRMIVQSHYVNPTPDAILVKDAINLGLIPEDQVEIWAAPFAHTVLDFEIPAGEIATIEFDCTWEDDATVLFLGGHMHDWGKAFSLDWTSGDTTERIYEVEEWNVEYRDRPPIHEYGDGDFTVAAGDVFSTSCTWDNTTDHTLGFPEEMCVTFGFAYESKLPLICAPQ
jgi:hypothetical protein